MKEKIDFDQLVRDAEFLRIRRRALHTYEPSRQKYVCGSPVLYFPPDPRFRQQARHERMSQARGSGFAKHHAFSGIQIHKLRTHGDSVPGSASGYMCVNRRLGEPSRGTPSTVHSTRRLTPALSLSKLTLHLKWRKGERFNVSHFRRTESTKVNELTMPGLLSSRPAEEATCRLRAAKRLMANEFST